MDEVPSNEVVLVSFGDIIFVFKVASARDFDTGAGYMLACQLLANLLEQRFTKEIRTISENLCACRLAQILPAKTRSGIVKMGDAAFQAIALVTSHLRFATGRNFCARNCSKRCFKLLLLASTASEHSGSTKESR